MTPRRHMRPRARPDRAEVLRATRVIVLFAPVGVLAGAVVLVAAVWAYPPLLTLVLTGGAR